MDFNQFITYFNEQFKSESGRDIFIKKVQETFIKDSDYEDFDRIVSLFLTHNGNGIAGKSQFFKIKAYTICLFRWLFNLGKIDRDVLRFIEELTPETIINRDRLQDSYFCSVDDMLEFFDYVGGRRGFKNDDCLLILKTIAILSWHGLTMNEIRDVQKASVRPNGVLIIQSRNKTLTLSEREYEILEKLSVVETIPSFPSGRNVVFVESSYLLRSSTSEQMSSAALINKLRRFNLIAMEETNRAISVPGLKKNGIMVTMKSLGGAWTPERIQRLLGCEKSVAWWYMTLYKQMNDIEHERRDLI